MTFCKKCNKEVERWHHVKVHNPSTNPEIAKKISLSNKGKVFSIEHRKKLSIVNKNNKAPINLLLSTKSRKGKTWEEIYGINKAKELRKIASINNSGVNHPLYGRVTSEKTKKLLSEKHKIWHKENPNFIRKILEKQKNQNTGIELKIKDFFDKFNIKYEQQYMYEYEINGIIKRGFADFYLPFFYLIVECDGTYWHSRPDTIFKDKCKDDFLNKKYIGVIRLTEKRINCDFENVCYDIIYAGRMNIKRILALNKDTEEMLIEEVL